MTTQTQTFTIANITGGNERTFRLRNGALPVGALEHARDIGCYGGPSFGGAAGEEAERLFLIDEENSSAA